ncbi:MAG TPA: 16S rRNA (guanine(527)-N(7))-methyltransferase RsmG [Polyangia bacterium]|jgi:16S rRNA (guanine527-N7)-methyltransferase|nr:16S rRNA (guanine(527)-N(7))-methyltransferase RsmG [Polyangia bacterium]
MVPKEEQALTQLRRMAEQWQLPLSRADRAALLTYGQLLLQWNERINLTGAKSLNELIDEHFSDAFAVARQIKSTAKVVDIGSGGGLPALPAALMAPQASILMVEPIRKKVAFLRTAIRTLRLSNRVSVVPERWEGALPGGRSAPFDVAMSRATFRPEDWLQKAWSLVRPEGRILALSAHRSLAIPDRLDPEDVESYADGTRWLLSFRRST